MGGLGVADLIFCFGLLYHTENPFQVIRNIERLTGQRLLLEPPAFPSHEPVLRFVDEGPYLDQGLTRTRR
jgi:hypothetical protein